MTVIKSAINKNSETWKQNYGQMKDLIAELQAKQQEALFQGEAKYVERDVKAGKLLARSRIEYVLDRDSPFLELLPFAGWGTNGFGTGGT